MTPPGGKAQKIRGEGPTADLAKERLAANVLRWKVRHGLVPASDVPETTAPDQSEVVVLTVHGWLNQWLDQHSDDEMSPGTRYGHERTIRNHIAPALGDIALTELTTGDIRTFVSTTLPAKRKPRDATQPLLGASAVRRIYFVLNSALNDAVKQELIPSNPGNRMDRPSRTRRASEQVEERTGDAMVILRNIEGKPDYLRWMLAFYGLRQSEVLGLTDDCLVSLQDTDRASLDVKQQLGRRYKRHGCGLVNLQGEHPCGKAQGRWCPQARGEEGLYLKEPKTPAAVRRIPVSGHLLSAARKHLRKQRALRQLPSFAPTQMLWHERLIIQPMWSLSRGFMEAVLTTCWLLDTTKTPEMRFARACSLLPSMNQGAIDALAKFPGSKEEYDAKVANRAHLIDYYKRNKVEVVPRLNRQKQPTEHLAAVVFREQKASFSRNVTQLAEWYLPDDGHLYPLLSGASHSDFWLVNGLETSSAGQALNSIVMPLFPISVGYTRAVAGYFGIDHKPYANRNQRRVMGLLMTGGGAKQRPTKDTSFGRRSFGLPHEFARPPIPRKASIEHESEIHHG